MSKTYILVESQILGLLENKVMLVTPSLDYHKYTDNFSVFLINVGKVLGNCTVVILS